MNKKGFTLVELLAVIVILAVVMLIGGTVVLPMMQKAQKSSLGTEGVSTLKSAEKTYSSDSMLNTKGYTSTSTVCYNLTYLCNNGSFDKGCTDKNDGYTGSVLVKHNNDGTYDYVFWISNGTYVYNASTKENFANIENEAILYEGNQASINCGKDIVEGSLTANAAAKSTIQNIYANQPSSKDIIYCNTDCTSSLSTKDLKNLESGYTEVEYLKGNGNQYINIKYTYQPGDILEATFSLDETTTDIQGIFGHGNTGLYGTSVYVTAALKPSFIAGGKLGSQYYNHSELVKVGAKTTVKIEGKDFIINGKKATTASYDSKNGTQDNFSLMRRYATNALHGKMYNMSIIRDNKYLFNFIPVKNASNVAGMYDLVNSKFYPNNGTGSFIVGNEL